MFCVAIIICVSDGLNVIVFNRRDVLSRLEQVLLLDLEFSNRKNTEQLMWKSAFYQVIEMLRRQEASDDDANFAKRHLLTIIDEVDI